MTLLATNLATNPSFEATSGQIALLTNQATNPGFENQPDPVVRTNLCVNPSFETSATGWGNGLYSSIGTSTVKKLYGTRSLLVTRTVSKQGTCYARTSMSVVAGQTYTVSFYVLGNATGCAFKDVNGVYTQFTPNTSSWTRVSATFTASVTKANALIYITDDKNLTPTKGTYFYVDAVLIEKSATLGCYFDGTTSVLPGVATAWTATRNASASTATALDPVILRRNLHINPAAANLSGDWSSQGFGVGGNGNYTYKTGSGLAAGPDTYVRKTWTVAANANNNSGVSTTNAVAGRFVPVVPGQVLSASGWVRYASASAKSTWTLRLYWYDATGAALVAGPGAGTVVGAMAANTWTQLTASGITVPAGAVFCSPVLDVDSGTAWAIGDTLDGTGMVLELGSFAGSYFDGGSPSATDLTYAWEGPAGNSPSRLYGFPITSVVSGPNALAVSSTAWKQSGTRSTRITAINSSRDTYADITQMFAGFTFLPSTTYTILGTRYIGGPQTAGANNGIGFKVNFGAADLTLTYLQATQNVTGANVVSATFTTPATGSLSYLRLYSNALAGEGDVLWDNILLIQGSYTGGYFDGNNSQSGDYTFSWTGDPDASASIQGIQAVDTIAGGANALVFQSSAWAALSSISMRIQPNTVNSSSCALGIGGDKGHGMQLGMIAGQTYTAMASIHLTAPQTGTLDAVARSIVPMFLVAGSYVTPTSVQATNTAGTQQLTLTFTVPAGATEAFIRLYNGASMGNGDVWWDDFLFVQGTYTGQYFDGDSSAFNGTRYSWTGPAHASTTTAIGADGSSGLELKVYDGKAPTTALGILARATNTAVMGEVSGGNGTGSFEIMQSDPVFTETPNLCNYRNVVRVSCNGLVTDAFLIQNVVKTQVSTNQGMDYNLAYTGEGLMTWFNDAVVYPEGGLKADSYTTRYFGFGSLQGVSGWYNPKQWTTPIVAGPYNPTQPIDYTSPWKGAPANWPPQAHGAKWVWSTRYSKTATPAGVNYFRKEFTTATDGAVTIFVTADDYFEAYIDSQQVLSASNQRGNWRSTFSASVNIPAGSHVFAIRAVNNSGPGGVLAAIFNAPDATSGALGSLIGQTGGTGWVACGYPTLTPSFTPGSLLLQLLAEAKARGVQFPNFVTPTFTATKDSNGVAWSNTFDWNFSVGTPYMSVIRTIESMGFEITISPDTLMLNMVPVLGKDRSVAIGTTDAIVLSTGLNLTQADGSAQANIVNSMLMQSNDGLKETVSASSQTVWGRIEGSSSITGSSGQGVSFANQTMNIQAVPADGATYTLSPVPGSVPNLDFFKGDYVLAPDSKGVLQRRRVMSITTANDDAGNQVYTLEFDTIFQILENRLSTWMTQVQSSTTSNGAATAIGNTTSSPSATPSLTPIGSDNSSNWVPSPPDNLVANLVPDWDSVGNALCIVDLSWDPVSTNTDGSDAQVLAYEVWAQNNSSDSGSPQTLAQTANSSVELQNLTWGANYSFQVRAIGTSGVYSDFSPALTIPLTPAVPVLDAPTNPVVASKLGMVQVSWDGNLNQTTPAPPPSRFDHLSVMMSPTSGGTYVNVGQNLKASGSVNISGLTVGNTYWYQLVAIDQQGNASAASNAFSVVVVGVAMVDVDTTISTAISNAQTTATSAQTSANGKNTIYYGPTAPTTPVSGASFVVNDVWFNTASGNAISNWNGTSWVLAQLGTTALAAGAVDATKLATAVNSAISGAQSSAAAAQVAANERGGTIYAPTAPTGLQQSTLNLWINTLNGANTPNVFSGAGTPNFSQSSLADIVAGAIRTNLVLDPCATNATLWGGRWFGGGSGAGTYTAQTGSGLSVGPSTFMRKTWTVAGSGVGNTGFNLLNGQSRIPATPGQSFMISGWLRTSASGKNQAQATLQWWDTTGTMISTSVSNGLALTPGVWTFVSLVAVAPANTVSMAPVLDVNGGSLWAPGDTLDGTGALCEAATSVRNYFDPVTTPGAWWGTGAWTSSTDQALAPAITAKGNVLYSPTAPTGMQQSSQSLWINTSGNANTPSVFGGNGTPHAATSSFSDAVAGVQRTNLCLNPSLETGTTGWGAYAGASGAATVTRGTDGGFVGAAYYRYTWTTTPTATGSGLYYTLAAATPGQAYSAAVWVRSSIAQNMVLSAEWKNSTGAFISKSTGTVIAVAAGAWTRISLVNAVAPTGTVTAAFTAYQATGGTLWPVGSTLDTDAMLIEALATVGTYFDGTSPGAWWGTGAWTSVTDQVATNAATAASNAQSTANAAQTSANGKNTVTYSAVAATGSGTATGDIWFQTTSGVVVGQWQWNGTTWVSQTIGSAVIAALDAGKITTGTLSASRIGAGTITGTMIAGTTITAANIAASTITAAQIAAGTLTAAQIAANTITAGQIAAGTITSTEIAANTITASDIAANTITAAQIAANTITATQMVTGTITAASGIIANAAIGDAQIAALDAGKITTGFIAAARIQADSITASKLLIGDFTNLADGSNFENPAANPWTLGTAWTLDTTQHNDGTTSLRCTGTSTGIATLNNIVTAVAGDQWYYELWAYRDASWNGTTTGSALKFTDQASTVLATLAYASTSIPAATWTKLSGFLTVPTGSTSITATLNTDATAGNLWVDDIVLRRKSAGELIVDGSITAQKIAANTITATQIAANTITTNLLAAGAIDGFLITGATIQTTATAARGVKFDSTGIKAYNSTGTLTINIDAATGGGTFTGTVNATAGTFSGSISVTGTLTGGTFQTASTGQRAKLNGAGFTLYTPSGYSGTIVATDNGATGANVFISGTSGNTGLYVGHNNMPSSLGGSSEVSTTDNVYFPNLYTGDGLQVPAFYSGFGTDSTTIAAGTSHNTTITFPAGTFSAAPSAVYIMSTNARFSIGVTSITATSAIVTMGNWSPAAGVPGTYRFLAVL